ncbi:hypothetical protein N9948_02135, partial [bacterium]|nr:hypothetical protein [bacterium]
KAEKDEKEDEAADAEGKKDEKEEEMKEEMKSSSQEISFEDGTDVMASNEEEALLSQLFSTKEATEEETQKEAKIKTLKNVTASKGNNEIDKLSALWNKEI